MKDTHFFYLAKSVLAGFRKRNMIDLKSKTVDEINELIQKYSPVLELIKEKGHRPYLAYVYDVGINHIKEHHNGLSSDWKAWAVFVINENYWRNKITNESDIIKTINDFIVYYNNEYQNYIDDLAVFSNDFTRDKGFVLKFLHKKIGS